MTSQSKDSSKTSASIINLDIPEEFTFYKRQCSPGEVCRKSSPLCSNDFGIPQIITIQKPSRKSSTYSSTSSVPFSSKSSSSHKPSQATAASTIPSKSLKPTKKEFLKPCSDSVIFGAPKSFIGKCPGHDKKQFKLTEDPRKRLCLKNPNRIHFKPIAQPLELAKVKEIIKTADNVMTPSGSQTSSSSLVEVIDLNNPFGLDFQGTDYKNTYERDEQACQNQIEYRKVRRFQHRKNVQLETADITEREQQAERIAIPKHFSVKTSQVKTKPKITFSNFLNEKKYLYGRLVRAEQKPEVHERLKKEDENRRERYKQLYLKKKEKMTQQEKEEIEAEQNVEKEKPSFLAEKDIQDLLDLLDRNITTKKLDPRQIPGRRKFPHNIAETIKFRSAVKKSKCVLKERAMVKQEFYERQGKPKKIPETQLEISTDSFAPSTTSEEQSTNDEDDMQVGQKESKFLLRGFRYKLGADLRGKFNQHELTIGDGKTKGCITRTEWFESLLSGDVLTKDQKDADTKLFPCETGLKPISARSAINEFRKKPLGRHYDRTIRKKLHIRKFNLIGFMYGNSTHKKWKKHWETMNPQEGNRLQGSTLEYMKTKIEKEELKQKAMKIQRMRYLGIPYSKEQRKKTKAQTIDSDSSDSDWVPEKIPSERSSCDNVEMEKRGNMPAPLNRETTLRVHPKHPRDYDNLRVPSAQLDEFLQNQHIPVLRKLRGDKQIMENVRPVQNTEYARKFDARHHHDHWNPTQHKSVNVRYYRKIVKPQDLRSNSELSSKEKHLSTFDKARPRRFDGDEQEFALLKVNIDEMIKNHRSEKKTETKTAAQEIRLESKDTIIRSLVEGELQEFPGRDKFLEFIREIKVELNKRAGLKEPDQTIDRKAFIDELKEDLISIEGCLSSLSSSECTNLSNDSGSFLMAGATKIPLDYLRKSVVPFEEMKRNRIEAVPIDASKEELNPYRTVPFAGQQKEQLAMTAAKDNFFTFNTRLQNGMRQRLEVQSAKKLLGPNKRQKATPQVATDIDELYIEDLKQAPSSKPFKWNSCRTMIKDALRKKFESMLIQGEIVRTKINDRRNEELFQQMMKSKELYEKLFAKWEKKEYQAAMEVVNKVKPYYEATDVYRKEFQELSKQYTVLNMDIVYIENDWNRRTILQNFHYLLADMEWRLEHDWIHRNDEGDLEGFKESIEKRSTVNIRQRDKDDAWAIKEYYEGVFLKNPHPIIVVFKSAKEFMDGIESLKSKTFVLLLELHYTLWILAELEQKYQEFSDWCAVELESKKKYAETKCANKYYMERRVGKLKGQVKVFLGEPIEETFRDKRLSQIKGICNEVYKDIVPVADQMEMSALEQVGTVSQILTDLLGKFENISVDQRIRVEKKHRRLLVHRRNMSKQSVLVERRIASELIKVQRNLAPRFVRPKREGKLPRSELKKITRVVQKKPLSISDQAKFFYKAFHEDGDLKDLREARESFDVMDTMQQSIVPFYFDHFLMINGYQPNYNFKTQVELRDGPEIDRMQVKELLPEVMEKFENWQAKKQRIMQENIARNPHMYQNVRI